MHTLSRLTRRDYSQEASFFSEITLMQDCLKIQVGCKILGGDWLFDIRHLANYNLACINS
jgi:hypothetical protein